MRTTKVIQLAAIVAGYYLALGLIAAPAVRAHCDTLDGPLVQEAMIALDKGNLTPMLKWVSKGDEAEIRSAFEKALIVRKKGKEARDLADRYFIETLVRLHRAGEGAPYTGLKPAGTDPGPAVKGADQALQTEAVAPLTKWLTEEVARGISQRFARAVETRKHADESVAQGRDFIKAYVEFIHYVEKLYLDTKGTELDQHQPGRAGAQNHKHQ